MCDVCGEGPQTKEWKSAPNTPERDAEIQESQREQILRTGHQVMGIIPDEGTDDAMFYYTVGRSIWDKPELLLTGNLSPRDGMSILNSIAKLENAGEIDIPTLATGGAVRLKDFQADLRFIRCDPEAGEMHAAITLADGRPLETYQVLWPDKEGRWPEDPAFNMGPQPLYPLLATHDQPNEEDS